MSPDLFFVRDSAARLDDEPARLRAVHRTRLLDGPRDPQFDSITALVRDVLDVPVCAVTLIDQDRQYCLAALGFEARDVPRSDAFCDHAVRSGKVMVVEDAQLDHRFRYNPMVIGEPYIRSYAGAPLVTPDHYQIGALCVVDTRPRSFSGEQLARLQRFSGVVVDMIELRTLSQQDDLTGARSRRGFVAALEAAIEHHARDGQAAALITLDIDHFKRINDGFGHAAGDEALKAVAAALRAVLRGDQTLGRLGGEEFGVLIPGAGIADALAGAERMRAAVARTKLPGLPTVTASFGIAPLETGADVARWFATSDRALYVAKRTGRNRCVLAPPIGADGVGASLRTVHA